MFARIRLGFLIASVIAATVQTIFFPTGDNLFCTSVCLVLSIIGYRVMGKPENCQEYPLSTISVLLFIFSSLSLPLIVSSIEFRPITRNLFLPVDVLSYLGLTVITVLLAHWAYRRLPTPAKVRTFVTNKIVSRLGLFKAPGVAQIWLMGFFGVACLYYKAYTLQGKGAVGDASIMAKVLTGLIPFAYAPFLIPFNGLFTKNKFPVTSRIAIPLLLFFGLILGAAVLRNDRSDFAMGPVIMMLSLAIGVLCQRIRIKKINFKLMAPIFIIVVFVYPSLADLALAMVIVRKEYGKQGARAEIDLTLQMYENRDDLHKLMDELNNEPAKYDETYYNSSEVFLERFANLKFHDNSLVLGDALTPGQIDQLKNFSIYNALAGFPDPFLKIAGLDFDKTQYDSMSVGDYFYYLNTGTGLGGFRVGSVIGHGLALFGIFFFPFFGIVILCYFVLLDSLTYRTKISVASVMSHDWRLRMKPVYSLPYFAPIALMNAFDMLNPYRWGSVAEIPLYILREMPENVVLYLFMWYATHWITYFYETVARKGARRRRLGSPKELPA